MEKEFNELTEALKGIVKIKDFMVERFLEKEERNLKIVQDVKVLNEKLQAIHSNALDLLYSSPDFKDKQFLFDKLIQYKGIDYEIEKKFSFQLEKNIQIRQTNMIPKLNEKIEIISQVLRSIQSLKESKSETIEFTQVNDLISQIDSKSRSSSFTLDHWLMMIIFILIGVILYVFTSIRPKQEKF
jgi:hypothetical protein